MYSVNWLTKVVLIPKADLTFVSASPEIYSLDVVQFWTEIHDIQDSEGMPYADIMRSNAPTTLSGQTYVRQIEVINGYRVEFEAGSYQVNLLGANNNLLDVRISNNVSINANNSAGAVVISLDRILDILEGDQHHDSTTSKFLVKHKDTKEILIEKDVTATPSPDIDLVEP